MSLAADHPTLHPLDTEPIDYLYAKDNGLLLTTEEFDAVDDAEEGYRYELIRGVLVVSPSPDPPERSISDELARQILNYRDFTPEGRSIQHTLPEHDIRIGRDRRRADRVIWLRREGKLKAKTTTPDILIEIVSPGSRNRRRDFIDKRDAYMSLDVREYWILDRVRRTMTVFARRDGGVTEKSLAPAETYTTELMPGFELRLAPLFAVVDELDS